MNRREKEEYLREYEQLKKKGKPFFPYAIAKDGVMFVLIALIIVAMSLILGAEQGPKADPTTTSYVPRPEWYFFFLFELLKVLKPPWLVPVATIGIPTLCMVLLLLLPFYDRSPERRITRRPIAAISGVMVIIAMAYLTFLGRRFVVGSVRRATSLQFCSVRRSMTRNRGSRGWNLEVTTTSRSRTARVR